ncbi:MAG: hypothetical protein C4325_12935 [Blastocatellia bacterium]
MAFLENIDRWRAVVTDPLVNFERGGRRGGRMCHPTDQRSEYDESSEPSNENPPALHAGPPFPSM